MFHKSVNIEQKEPKLGNNTIRWNSGEFRKVLWGVLKVVHGLSPAPQE